MISYISGNIQSKGASFVVVMTSGGVGYKVFIPIDLITHITPSSPVKLYTYTHVKEDALELYGFPNFDDLSLFELLLRVSGIGPKTAMGVFSAGRPEIIKEAIVKGDVEFFMTVPRLGRKNAQKIIIELRSKLGSLADLDLTAEGGETKEIIDALKSFGFSTSEAKDALKFIKDVEGDTSVKIKQALKYLGKK